MAPDGSSHVDARPWALTAMALFIAIAMNVATGNRLWLYYSVTGTVVFLVIMGFVRLRRIDVPPMAVWMVGVAAALHYVGGSLAGVHRFGGVNGLYHAFPWWDNVVHFLGSFALGVAAAALLARDVPRPGIRMVLATCFAVTVGNLVELYEFSQFVFFGTIDQGFYTNTLLDLYYNGLGAASGAVVYVRFNSIQARPADPRFPGEAASLRRK